MMHWKEPEIVEERREVMGQLNICYVIVAAFGVFWLVVWYLDI